VGNSIKKYKVVKNFSKTTKKQSSRQLLNHPLIVLGLTLLCILAILSLEKSKDQAEISKQSIKQLEDSVKQLENADQEQARIATTGQSELTLEKIQRNELLLQKTGEIILQIPEKEILPNNKEDSEVKNGPLEEWKRLLLE